jgi:hypothetical protein
VPGTDLDGSDRAIELLRRASLIRTLTLSGWLLFGGSIGMLAYQLRQMRDLDGSSAFGGDVWDRRIEVLSFVMLPPNLVVLAPTVTIAVVAAWLAGRSSNTWLVSLVRICAGLAAVMAAIGTASIVSIIVRDEAGPSDWGDVFLRLGGISMALGMALLCLSAERHMSVTESPHDSSPL